MEKTLEALKNFGIAIEHIHVEKDTVDEGYSQKDIAVFECERKERFRCFWREIPSALALGSSR